MCESGDIEVKAWIQLKDLGFSYSDLGKKSGSSKNSVKGIISRARKNKNLKA